MTKCRSDTNFHYLPHLRFVQPYDPPPRILPAILCAATISELAGFTMIREPQSSAELLARQSAPQAGAAELLTGRGAAEVVAGRGQPGGNRDRAAPCLGNSWAVTRKVPG